MNARAVEPSRSSVESSGAGIGASELDGRRWSALLAIMREALDDAELAEFEAHVKARRMERDRSIALAAALGWREGRSALGREIAARRAARRAGAPSPADVQPPPLVAWGLAQQQQGAASDLEGLIPRLAAWGLAQPDGALEPGRAIATSGGARPQPAEPSEPEPSEPSGSRLAAMLTMPPPCRVRRPRYDGRVRLGRVTVPGTTRARCIAQVPIDDARDASNNSLVYGFGLRTLMAAGAATRRTALAAIVAGQVNPHDPIDVVRWALARRGRLEPDLEAALDALAVGARATRARVSAFGVDVAAGQLRADESSVEPSRSSVESSEVPIVSEPTSRWDGVAAAIETIAQLRGDDLARLAGLLASGDHEVARAWAQENAMQREGVV